MRVKRAGFKPTLNLLYAIEGALQDCHWQEISDERRGELIAATEAAIALLPPPRYRPAAGPVTTTQIARGVDGDAVAAGRAGRLLIPTLSHRERDRPP